jgi:hypothetical protein
MCRWELSEHPCVDVVVVPEGCCLRRESRWSSDDRLVEEDGERPLGRRTCGEKVLRFFLVEGLFDICDKSEEEGPTI